MKQWNNIFPNDWFMAVALDNIDGVFHVNKFGRADDIDTGSYAAVWDGKSAVSGYPDIDYTWPSDTGATFYISSSNAGDDQTYIVSGLDENFELKHESIAVNGQAFVALSGLWTRVFRVKNFGTTANAGRIMISNSNTGTAGLPTDTSAIKALVTIDKGQSLMALYTIPAGHTGYLIKLFWSCGKADDFSLELLMRPFGGVWLIKDHQHIYQNVIERKFTPYMAIAEKTDIACKAEAITTGNTPISAGFDLIIVEND